MYGLNDDVPQLKELSFAVHTYYALFIKLLGLQVAHFFLMPKMGTALSGVASYDSDRLHRYLEELERGGLFAQLGIRNFLEGDFFAWYLGCWSDELAESVREVVGQLGRYSLVTLDVDPEETRDLLKQVYQNLMPRQLRHALGEYYTPDWLAELLLSRRHFEGDPETRLLDPACGSGTFLVQALKKVRQYAAEKMLPPSAVLRCVLQNVVGYDLNPLAIVSARTNYLLALGDLLQHRDGDVDIPVYLADSVLTPSEGKTLLASDAYHFTTSVGDFSVPRSLVERQEIDQFVDFLEETVANALSASQFADAFAARFRVHNDSERESAQTLFEKLSDLESRGVDGIWARIIRNAFAPRFQPPFDLIVGNPPWINWESLPSDYRQATKELWTRHNLFPHQGFETILGKGKKDISMLITFVAADDYLRTGGKLGFVITQSLLKTAGAGDGFRKLIPASGIPLAVVMADDMVEIAPFEGASNRTALIVLEKGRTTKYPVAYSQWTRRGGKRIPESASLKEALSLGRVMQHVAQPVDPDDLSSPWITGRRRALSAVTKVLGDSYYQARAGASTWMNGVYWLRVLESVPGGLLVTNVPETGKAKIDLTQAVIEPNMVYPLLRAGEVARWKAEPRLSILVVQDLERRRGYDEGWLKVHYPKTFAYLARFEDILRQRSGYRRYFKPPDPFYSMFNVADYTLSKHKVVFPSIGSDLMCVVISERDGRPIVPQHIVTMVQCESEKEAHFICACLNSSPARFALQAYSQKGGKSFATPQVLEHISVPRYDSSLEDHGRLVALSQEAHAAAREDVEVLPGIEAQIDVQAACVWGLSPQELHDLQLSLKEAQNKQDDQAAPAAD